MRTIVWAATVLTILTGFSAHAMEFQTPVTKQLYTCDQPGVSRVAMRSGFAPCCDGKLKCAELLSTTGLLPTRKHGGRT